MKQHTEDYKQSAVKYYLEHNEDTKITEEHLTNYLKHSYKIYK